MSNQPTCQLVTVLHWNTWQLMLPRGAHTQLVSYQVQQVIQLQVKSRTARFGGDAERKTERAKIGTTQSLFLNSSVFLPSSVAHNQLK